MLIYANKGDKNLHYFYNTPRNININQNIKIHYFQNIAVDTYLCDFVPHNFSWPSFYWNASYLKYFKHSRINV